MRAWVEKRTGFPSDFDIKFYPGMPVQLVLKTVKVLRQF